MDNQVAINFLDQARKILLDDKSWLESTRQPINEVFDMAISALRAQDLQQTCNKLATDTISRQAAIDALHMHLMYRLGTDSNKKRLDDWINGVPSVQPEPEEDCDTCKHGYFGDSQCNNCRMRFPSHYEREEEQHEET